MSYNIEEELIMKEKEDNVEEKVLTFFEEKWKTTFRDNHKTLKKFKGSKYDSSYLLKQPLVYHFTMYIRDIYYYITHVNTIGEIPKHVKNEIAEYERKGGQCIYLSVLLYNMLHRKGIGNGSLKYCQGYYSHRCREDNPLGRLLGEYHMGLHAWVELNHSVIDISIKQEDTFFDFKDEEFIFGEVPEGLRFIGYEETHIVAKEYARDIAKFSEMNYFEWIDSHIQAAINNSEVYLE